MYFKLGYIVIMPGQKGPAVVKPSICYMPIYLYVYTC